MAFLDFFSCKSCTHTVDRELEVEALAAGRQGSASPGRAGSMSPGRQGAMSPGRGTLLARACSTEAVKENAFKLAAAEGATPSTIVGAEGAFPAASPLASPKSTGEEDLPQAGPLRVPDVRATLTPKELAAVNALEAELRAEGMEKVRAMLVPGEAVESCLLRFLVNHGMKAKAAAKALHVVAAWRATEQPEALADRSIGDIAGCSEELLNRYMPTWHQGFDKRGRPVVFSHYGKFRFAPVLEAGVTVEKILQLHVRNSERNARLCGEQSAKLGQDISNSLIVLDTEGWDNNNLKTKAAFDWARGIAKIDGELYPERMGQMFVINAPPSVNYFYKLVSWFLPEKARNQVKIFAGREQWEPALLELVDAAQLPPEYGGTGAPSLAAGP